MSTPMMAFAIRLTRCWVRLYTAGLPPELRDARRAEIESDLWEQGDDAIENGSRPDETVLQVLLRLLAGVPADLSWRLEAGGAARRIGKPKNTERRGNVNTSLAQRALLALAVLLTLGFVVGGVATIASTSSTSQYYREDMILGVLGISGAAIFLTGLYITRWWSSLGGSLVVAGAISMGFSMFWLVVPPILALLMAYLGIVRARRFAGERDRIATA